MLVELKCLLNEKRKNSLVLSTRMELVFAFTIGGTYHDDQGDWSDVSYTDYFGNAK